MSHQQADAVFDRFHEECGVVGIYGHPEAANLAYLALYALQHRGQESAGIASSNGQTLLLHRGMGLVADIFDEKIIRRLGGSSAIGHKLRTLAEKHWVAGHEHRGCALLRDRFKCSIDVSRVGCMNDHRPGRCSMFPRPAITLQFSSALPAAGGPSPTSPIRRRC